MDIRDYILERFFGLDEASIEAYKQMISGGKKLPALMRAVPKGIQTGVLKGTNAAKKVGLTSGTVEKVSGNIIHGVHS